MNEEKMKDHKERLEKAKEMGSQEKAKEMGSQKPNEPVEGPKEPRTPINRKWLTASYQKGYDEYDEEREKRLFWCHKEGHRVVQCRRMYERAREVGAAVPSDPKPSLGICCVVCFTYYT